MTIEVARYAASDDEPELPEYRAFAQHIAAVSSSEVAVVHHAEVGPDA